MENQGSDHGESRAHRESDTLAARPKRNPRGRPAKARPITTALEQLLGEQANSFELETFPNRSYAEAIARHLVHVAAFGSPRAAICATSIILERIEGRPAQPPVEDENDQRGEKHGPPAG